MATRLPSKPAETVNIAIIGLRGVGKSTLALMALADLGFDYVDVEKCVSAHTGKPEAVYLKEVTVDEYQELQYRLVTAKLKEHEGRLVVVVMPLTVVNLRRLLELLRLGLFRHVVHVECEPERILRYMNMDAKDSLAIVAQRAEAFRAVATRDFFNLFSEIAPALVTVGDALLHELSFFILKPVQRDFSRFLTMLVRGSDAAWALTGNLHLRGSGRRSNSLVVTPEDTLTPSDLVGVDALELRLDLIDLVRSSMNPLARVPLPETVARLRRILNSLLPLAVSVNTCSARQKTFISELASAGTDPAEIQAALTAYHAALLGSVFRVGADYLFLDLGMFDGASDAERARGYKFFGLLLENKGATEVVGVYDSNAPNFWDMHAFKVLELAQSLGLTSVRFSSLAARVLDNFKVLAFKSHASQMSAIKISAYNRNDLGKISQILNYERTPVHLLATVEKMEQAEAVGYAGSDSSAAGEDADDDAIEEDGDEDADEDVESSGSEARASLTPTSTKTRVNPLPAFDDEGSDVCFTAISLQNALSATSLTTKLRVYIMGSNVASSVSPLLHETAYQSMALPYRYELFECSELMPHLRQLVRRPNFGGAAIIMPFKLDALQHVDTMSNHVKVIGALNTIIPQRDPDRPDRVLSIRGENTDWLGVRIALQDNTSPINSAKTNKVALVLGAGGMARSAIYALIQLGYSRILLYNRTRARAELLKNHYNALSPLLPSRVLTTGEVCKSQEDLRRFEVVVISEEEFMEGRLPAGVDAWPVSIVSCIPSTSRDLGDKIHVPIHGNWFQSDSGGTLLETGYLPLFSSVFERAMEFRDRGWTAVNGLTWVLAQAIAQFEMFTGKQAPVLVMKEALNQRYRAEVEGPRAA